MTGTSYSQNPIIRNKRIDENLVQLSHRMFGKSIVVYEWVLFIFYFWMKKKTKITLMRKSVDNIFYFNILIDNAMGMNVLHDFPDK